MSTNKIVIAILCLTFMATHSLKFDLENIEKFESKPSCLNWNPAGFTAKPENIDWGKFKINGEEMPEAFASFESNGLALASGEKAHPLSGYIPAGLLALAAELLHSSLLTDAYKQQFLFSQDYGYQLESFFNAFFFGYFSQISAFLNPEKLIDAENFLKANILDFKVNKFGFIDEISQNLHVKYWNQKIEEVFAKKEIYRSTKRVLEILSRAKTQDDVKSSFKQKNLTMKTLDFQNFQNNVNNLKSRSYNLKIPKIFQTLGLNDYSMAKILQSFASIISVNIDQMSPEEQNQNQNSAIIQAQTPIKSILKNPQQPTSMIQNKSQVNFHSQLPSQSQANLHQSKQNLSHPPSTNQIIPADKKYQMRIYSAGTSGVVIMKLRQKISSYCLFVPSFYFRNNDEINKRPITIPVNSLLNFSPGSYYKITKQEVKENDIVLLAEQSILKNLPLSLIAVLVTAVASEDLQISDSDLKLQQRNSLLQKILRDYFTKISKYEKKEAISLFQKEFLTTKEVLKQKEVKSFSDCSLLDIFYFEVEKGIYLSDCILKLLTSFSKKDCNSINFKNLLNKNIATDLLVDATTVLYFISIFIKEYNSEYSNLSRFLKDYEILSSTKRKIDNNIKEMDKLDKWFATADGQKALTNKGPDRPLEQRHPNVNLSSTLEYELKDFENLFQKTSGEIETYVWKIELSVKKISENIKKMQPTNSFKEFALWKIASEIASELNFNFQNLEELKNSQDKQIFERWIITPELLTKKLQIILNKFEESIDINKENISAVARIIVPTENAEPKQTPKKHATNAPETPINDDCKINTNLFGSYLTVALKQYCTYVKGMVLI